MPAAAGTGRLARAFTAGGRTGLIPFLTAGYPSLDSTLTMMRGFEALGARAVEIGVPFSDPIADGPEIQRASEWALRNGVGPEQALDLVARFRTSGDLPVVLMTYANPILAMGIETFAARAQAAGVDGVIVSDLPPDELPEAWSALDRAGLDTIVLVAPTTDPGRLPLLLARCRGFLYCLARTGVTGRSAGGSDHVASRVTELRRMTKLPIAVGFGISNAADAARLDGVADAIIVGAAFMRAISEDPASGAETRVQALATGLVAALK